MSNAALQKLMDNVEASINMEGLYVSDRCKQLCKELLNNEITFEEYLNMIEENYDNSVAMTPPMGWSSWNLFRNKINEDLIYETAKALKDSGLAEKGVTGSER